MEEHKASEINVSEAMQVGYRSVQENNQLMLKDIQKKIKNYTSNTYSANKTLDKINSKQVTYFGLQYIGTEQHMHICDTCDHNCLCTNVNFPTLQDPNVFICSNCLNSFIQT
jgi:hypothetical protein